LTRILRVKILQRDNTAVTTHLYHLHL
jgi:hypothetical protein